MPPRNISVAAAKRAQHRQVSVADQLHVEWLAAQRAKHAAETSVPECDQVYEAARDAAKARAEQN